jgi:phosphoglycolate phosphatase
MTSGSAPHPGSVGGRAGVRLAVLDMAGTTVSDDGVVLAAFAGALEAVGWSAARIADEATDYVVESMGRSKQEVFTELLGGDREGALVATAAFEEHYERAVEGGGISPLPGAEEALARLRALGVRICLTTGFAPGTREAIVRSLGWTSAVDLALSPADAGRGRPWPDMVLTALMRLEIDDVRHVAVAGDTTNDLLAGWRAGASVVAGVLTGAHDRERLATAPHTHLIDSIAELPEILTCPE